MKKIKILVFVLMLAISCSVPFTAFAEEYGNKYPSYVQQSGGAYIEVQSSLGRGAFIFQSEFKNGYFGFYGSGYNLCNLSKSSISGSFILENGKVYEIRFTSFNTADYYYRDGYNYEWLDLTVSKIYNTNVEFIDDKLQTRNNKIDLFEKDVFKYSIFAMSFITTLCVGFIVLKGVKTC